MSLEDESGWIRRAQAGDREAFAQLVRTHERRLFALAIGLCRNFAEAEDLSQDAWLKAFEKLRGFRGDCPFFAWVRQILLNGYLSSRRRPGLELLPVADESATVEASAESRVLIASVWGTLGSLSPQERTALLLRYREDMKLQEIAGILGCSTGAVKKVLYRAIQKLRAQVSPALVRK